MYNDITCIVLCGGKSTRMKENKSFLKFGDKTTIEIVVDLVRSKFHRVILSTNSPEDYEFLNLEIIEDFYKNAGPLAGIHAGLTKSYTKKNFVIGCDIPLMKSEMIDFLINYPSAKNIVVPKADGFIQQLCALYDKECLPIVEEILKSNSDEKQKKKCKILTLIDRVGAEIINVENEFSQYPGNLFLNMNYPNDYQTALKLLE